MISFGTKIFNRNFRKLLRNQFLLQLHIKLANILGICPVQNLTQNYNYKKIYPCLILTILISFTIWAGMKRVSYGDMMSFRTIVSISTFISLTWFSMALLKNSVCSVKSWGNFLQSLFKFDNDCGKAQEVVGRKCLKRFLFILIRLTFLCYILIDHRIWASISKNHYTLLYFPQYIGLFYEMNVAAFFWEVSAVLESRYNYVHENLLIILNRYSGRHISLLKLEWNSEIIRIKYLYKLLFISIKEIDAIFGFILLFFFMHIQATFIGSFNWLLIMVPGSIAKIYFIAAFVPVTSGVSKVIRVIYFGLISSINSSITSFIVVF